MPKRTIRLCYRKVINANSSGAWEKLVFEDSYLEFLMQAQFYNQEKKYTSFAQLLNVKGAEQLHFLVSSAVTGYLHQLNGVIPDVANALGKLFLPFTNYRFEIINSDIMEKGRHQVAINFYSEDLLWINTIGTQLLISLQSQYRDGVMLTELVSLQPFLSIYSVTENA